MDHLIVTTLAICLAILLFVVVKLFFALNRLKARFASVIDVDAELARVSEALWCVKNQQKDLISESERRRAHLVHEYEGARTIYEFLRKEISLLEENLEDISFGMYKPHFSFQTSDEYKVKREAVRVQQKRLIHGEKATFCSVNWTVGGSAKEGARMSKRNAKLVLRAFNGECDAAVANVVWNNVTRMEERIRKSFEAINKLGTVLQLSITQEFLKLKLDELRLTYEYEQKRHEEQEEQRRIREQMREEEKAQREIEKAREEAEREEIRFERALEKARVEAARASGLQLEQLNERMRTLQNQLEEAHKQKERAISRAQLTKSGHVYVISNIGSFGEHVYKVGMTRRWEPIDRIKELGDASVPFPFDVHAMIYSENAPELESSLQRVLSEQRVNLSNTKKEFFQVPLDEIEKIANEQRLTVEFTKLAEAQEYRQTLALREKKSQSSVSEAQRFPPRLFENAAANTEATVPT